MKKLVTTLLAAAAVALFAAGSAEASYIYNTGWPCPYAGATAPAGPSAFYSCYGTPLTWHYVYYGP